MKTEASSISNKQALVDSDQITSSVLGNFFAMVNLNAKQRKENGEEDISKLWSKPKLRVEGNPPVTSIRSLCLVLEGSCSVTNDDFEVLEMRPGNHFGASDLLRIPDIEFLGNISAGAKGLKVMVIPNPDQVL